MFQATEQQSKRPRLLPPIEPTQFPFKNGKTIWNGLYGHLDLKERPTFCTLYISIDPLAIQIDDVDRAENANIDVLNDKRINEAVIQPLLALLSDIYEVPPALCLTERGEMWVMTKADAIETIHRGYAPGSKIEIPKVFEWSWMFCSKFSSVEFGQNPVVKSVGMVLFGVFLLLLVGVLRIMAIATSAVAEPIEKLLLNLEPNGDYYYVAALIALAWQAINLLFLFPPARKAVIVIVVINCLVSVVYAYFDGASWAMIAAHPIIVIGLYTLPVFVILYLVGNVIFLSPILTWLPNQAGKIAALSINRYKLERHLAQYDYQQKLNQDIRVLKRETRYLP